MTSTKVSLRINSLEMENVGCFQKISLTFSPSFNLICGANGVGKSTILAVIGRAFSHHQSQLRRRAAAETAGTWRVSVADNDWETVALGRTEGVMPAEQDEPKTLLVEKGRSLFYFKANRDFLYSSLNAIERDPSQGVNEYSSAASFGIDQSDLKRWLANRYLFAAHDGSLSSSESENFEFAKSCFSILDPRVEFSSVEASTFDVFVNTQHGRVPFEYLSSGYRAALAMLLGIIHEVEIRRIERRAANFDGVILIDELDLHLHPAWQRSFVDALKRAFPEAQFIVTTHSPHMIQNAESEEVIALVNDESGSRKLAFKVADYGFKGWTIEEILQDVMGLPEVASYEFTYVMREFDSALGEGDGENVSFWLRELESMLHPRNPLRKLLRLQAAPFENNDD